MRRYDLDNPYSPRSMRMKRRFRRKVLRANRYRGTVSNALCKLATLFFVLGALAGVVLFLNIMDTDERLKYVALDRSKHMLAFVGVIALNAIGLVLLFVGRFFFWKGSSKIQTYFSYVKYPETAILTPALSLHLLMNGGMARTIAARRAGPRR